MIKTSNCLCSYLILNCFTCLNLNLNGKSCVIILFQCCKKNKRLHNFGIGDCVRIKQTKEVPLQYL